MIDWRILALCGLLCLAWCHPVHAGDKCVTQQATIHDVHSVRPKATVMPLDEDQARSALNDLIQFIGDPPKHKEFVDALFFDELDGGDIVWFDAKGCSVLTGPMFNEDIVQAILSDLQKVK